MIVLDNSIAMRERKTISYSFRVLLIIRVVCCAKYDKTTSMFFMHFDFRLRILQSFRNLRGIVIKDVYQTTEKFVC